MSDDTSQFAAPFQIRGVSGNIYIDQPGKSSEKVVVVFNAGQDLAKPIIDEVLGELEKARKVDSSPLRHTITTSESTPDFCKITLRKKNIQKIAVGRLERIERIKAKGERLLNILNKVLGWEIHINWPTTPSEETAALFDVALNAVHSVEERYMRNAGILSGTHENPGISLNRFAAQSEKLQPDGSPQPIMPGREELDQKRRALGDEIDNILETGGSTKRSKLLELVERESQEKLRRAEDPQMRRN